SYLLNITASRSYNTVKNRIWDLLGDNSFRRFLQRWVRALKSWFVKKPGGDLFEAMGFRYFGPIDGNDIGKVVETLRKLHRIPGPRLLHCITVKGKGYAPAEADPVTWHAPGHFDPATGRRIHAPHPRDRYQDVFGEVLCELAAADSRVVGVTPAMATGCGMNLLASRFPGQFFDVGIEEEHAVTFSAGLAAGGMRPFCNIYSAFAQRAYDQIIHDVALQRLPVVLCFDRAGLVGEDGATHHGAFDLAAYRAIPETVISAPRNELELKRLMHTALALDHGPFIIRYPRGMGEGVAWRDVPVEPLPVGKAEVLVEGNEVAILALDKVPGLVLDLPQVLRAVSLDAIAPREDIIVSSRPAFGMIRPVPGKPGVLLLQERQLVVPVPEDTRGRVLKLDKRNAGTLMIREIGRAHSRMQGLSDPALTIEKCQ
ncbi:MAG: hypothetical protein J6U26_02285, partial [Lachnospiraceae bacterium]|nr:hypothetical protein [Lachnospiraceae bacterium]